MLRKQHAGILIVLALVGLSYGIYHYYDELFFSYNKISQRATARSIQLISDIQRDINATSSPLRLENLLRGAESDLTADGVLVITNEFRSINARTPLRNNEALNRAAAMKVKDMFEKQYFAHVGPDGRGVDHWATAAEYRFLKVGENLALGGFRDDRDLVTSWMESPGHRDNILNETFEEIGIAVGRGVYEGQETWIAVQVFGLPEDVCPLPDQPLKDRIEQHQRELDDLEQRIEELRQKIDTTKGSERNRYIEQHNRLVEEYNRLAGVIREEIATYNDSIRKTQECLDQY